MKTAHAIDLIKAGGVLMAEYDEEDGLLHFRISNAGGITARQPEAIIRTLQMQPNRDGLFDGAAPQTWALP